jgi:hypothetical protein
MYSPKTLKSNNSFPVLSGTKPININGFSYKNPPPFYLSKKYIEAIANYGEWYFEFASIFHETYKSPNYTADNFMKYFKDYCGIGYEIICYIPKTNNDPMGRWNWTNNEKKDIEIFVANNLSVEVKKTTIIHESLHALQEIDESFKRKISKYPLDLQTPIIERITNKTMVEIVLPKMEFLQCIKKGWTKKQISRHYNVSRQLVNNYF